MRHLGLSGGAKAPASESGRHKENYTQKAKAPAARQGLDTLFYVSEFTILQNYVKRNMSYF
jgi:hypothetical protein